MLACGKSLNAEEAELLGLLFGLMGMGCEGEETALEEG